MTQALTPQALAPFWQFLSDWLRSHDWTQVRLADEVGVHETVVGKWLHADVRRRIRPGNRTVGRLAAVLDISIDSIMTMVSTDLDEIEGGRITARQAARALRGASQDEIDRAVVDSRRAALISIVRDQVPDEDLTALERMLSGYRLLRKFLPDHTGRAISEIYPLEYLTRLFAEQPLAGAAQVAVA